MGLSYGRIFKWLCLGVAGMMVRVVRSAPVNDETSIGWRPCEGADAGLPLICGTFKVAIDYANPSAGEFALAIVRVPATPPSLGHLFVNPGGPGTSGIEFFIDGGFQTISKVVNGKYDLISFDPRGVGRSQPSLNCFSNAQAERNFWAGTIIVNGIETRGNFVDQDDIDALYAQAPALDAKIKQFSALCSNSSGAVLPYIGTTAVVRDLEAMASYFDGPGKAINFWGFSYGTVIASYLINMLPSRVGKVVLDGVVHPVAWASGPAYKQPSYTLASSDEAFQGFTTACSAAETGCAVSLAAESTYGKHPFASDIQSWTDTLLSDAYYATKKNIPGSTRSSDIRAFIFDQLYTPRTWNEPDGLALKLVQTQSDLQARISAGGGLKAKRMDMNASSPAIVAYTCGDSPDYNVTTLQVLQEIVRVAKEVSPMFGSLWSFAGNYCHIWKPRAVERFSGPWNSTLSNRVLIIGNEADPVTPLANARWVANALGDQNAVLVQQDDWGHVSLAMKSNCTLAALSAYFLEGKLPEDEVLCGTDEVLFNGPSITKTTTTGLPIDREVIDYKAKINKLEARERALYGVSGGLALLALLLLGALVYVLVQRSNVPRKVTPYGPIPGRRIDLGFAGRFGGRGRYKSVGSMESIPLKQASR